MSTDFEPIDPSTVAPASQTGGISQEQTPDTQSKQGKLEKSDESDFITMLILALKKINFTVAIFIFIMGMVIFSTIFNEKVLGNISNAIVGDTPTTKGTMIQMVFLCLGYIVIDVLHQMNII